MLVAYAVLMTYIGNLRVADFYAANWDLGINQQMLWTAAHGRLLYEAGDFEQYGASSFLQVHSTYIAFLVAPIYSAAPTPLTLLSLQSAIFSLSGIPLYLLARRRTESPWIPLLAVSVYFACFGVTSSLTYDFHWESFLPLEFLCLFLVLQLRRYGLGLAIILIGSLTLEVFPFLAAGALIFFLLEKVKLPGWRWKTLRIDHGSRALVGLLVAAAAIYVGIRVGQYVVVPALLGVPSISGGRPGGIAGVIAFSSNSVTLPHSIAYWLLLLTCFGFLPLLSPRHLVLSLPWFYYSVIVAPVFSSHFGSAYGLVAIGPLAVAFIAGLERFSRLALRGRLVTVLALALAGGTALLALIGAFPGESARILGNDAGVALWAPLLSLLVVGVALGTLRWSTRRRRSPHGPGRIASMSRDRRTRAVPLLLACLVVAILAFDVEMSPMNPTNFDATPFPGYEFSWSQNPLAQEMGWLVGFVPAGAEILASNHLFPYVANDPNAWPVPWTPIGPSNPFPQFPFTPNHLPTYVLVDSSEYPFLPSFLDQALSNRSVYGLVAYVTTTAYPGTVSLFGLGYSQPAQGRNLVVASHIFPLVSPLQL